MKDSISEVYEFMLPGSFKDEAEFRQFASDVRNHKDIYELLDDPGSFSSVEEISAYINESLKKKDPSLSERVDVQLQSQPLFNDEWFAPVDNTKKSQAISAEEFASNGSAPAVQQTPPAFSSFLDKLKAPSATEQYLQKIGAPQKNVMVSESTKQPITSGQQVDVVQKANQKRAEDEKQLGGVLWNKFSTDVAAKKVDPYEYYFAAADYAAKNFFDESQKEEYSYLSKIQQSRQSIADLTEEYGKTKDPALLPRIDLSKAILKQDIQTVRDYYSGKIKKAKEGIEFLKKTRDLYAAMPQADGSIGHKPSVASYDKSIQEAEAELTNLFGDYLTNPETSSLPVYSENKEAIESSGIPGDTPMQKVRNYFVALNYERDSLWAKREAINKAIQKEDKLFADSKKVAEATRISNRIRDLDFRLKSLAPIAVLNRFPAIEDSFKSALKRSVAEEFGVYDQLGLGSEGAQQVVAYTEKVNQALLLSDDNLSAQAKADIEKGKKGPEAFSEAWFGSIAGSSIAMIPSMFIGGAMVKGVSTAIKFERFLRVLRRGTKMQKLVSKLLIPVEEGLSYVAAKPFLSEQSKGEATFLSGYLGGSFSKLFGAIASEKAIEKLIGKMFNENAGKAKVILEKLVKLQASATGESFEEYGNTFGSLLTEWITTRDYEKFKLELEKNFGTFDKNLEFVIGAYSMGIGMGSGSQLGSDAFKAAKAGYDRLTGKQKAAFDKVKKAMDGAIVDADIQAGNTKKGKKSAPEKQVPEKQKPEDTIPGITTADKIEAVQTSLQQDDESLANTGQAVLLPDERKQKEQDLELLKQIKVEEDTKAAEEIQKQAEEPSTATVDIDKDIAGLEYTLKQDDESVAATGQSQLLPEARKEVETQLATLKQQNVEVKQQEFKQAGETSKKDGKPDAIADFLLQKSKVGDTILDKSGEGYEITEAKTTKNGTKEITLVPFEIVDGKKEYNLPGTRVINEKSKKNVGDLYEFSYTKPNGKRVTETYTYTPATTAVEGETTTTSNATPSPRVVTQGDTVQIPELKTKKGTPLEMIYDNGEWKQKTGNATKLAPPGIQQQAQKIYDSQNGIGVSSEVGIGQEPVKAKPIEGSSAQATPAGGDVQTSEEVAGDVTGDEYKNFIDKGVVTKERISAIANKVKNNEKLSPKETEIFTDKTSEVNKELEALKDKDEKAAPVKEEAAKEEPAQEEEAPEPYTPVTKKGVSVGKFTRDEALDYEEDEKELDSGRMSTYISSMTVGVVDDETGDTVGRIVKLKDEDGNVTWKAEDADGLEISDEEYGTKDDALDVILADHNKKSKKEFDKEQKRDAKQKIKDAEKKAKAEAKAAEKKAKSEAKAAERAKAKEEKKKQKESQEVEPVSEEQLAEDAIEEEVDDVDVDELQEAAELESPKEAKKLISDATKQMIANNFNTAKLKIYETIKKGVDVLKKILEKIKNNMIKSIIVAGFAVGGVFGKDILGMPNASWSDVWKVYTDQFIKRLPKEMSDKLVAPPKKDELVAAKKDTVKIVADVNDSAYKASLERRGEKIGETKEGFWKYRNQWLNEKGFVYISGRSHKNNRGAAKTPYTGVMGVAHFMIMINDALDVTMKTTDEAMRKSTALRLAEIGPNEYAPVMERFGDGKVRVIYKQKKDIKPGEFAPAKLNQQTWSNLDFDNPTTPGVGNPGSLAPRVISQNKAFVSIAWKSSKDAYTEKDGGSVVFIFKDKFGNTIVRDFAGSVQDIINEANSIKQQFNITGDQLTIGAFDGGSYIAKPIAYGGVIDQGRYYWNQEKSGSSLMIPTERYSLELDREMPEDVRGEVEERIDEALNDVNTNLDAPVSIEGSLPKNLKMTPIVVDQNDTRPEADSMRKLRVPFNLILGKTIGIGMSDTLTTGERTVPTYDPSTGKINKNTKVREEGGIGYPFKSLIDFMNGAVKNVSEVFGWAAVTKSAASGMVKAAKKADKISGKDLKAHYFKSFGLDGKNLTKEQQAQKDRLEEGIPDDKQFGLVAIYKMGADGIKSNEAFAREAFRQIETLLTEDEKKDFFEKAKARLSDVKWEGKNSYIDQLRSAKNFAELEDMLHGDKSKLNLKTKAEIISKVFLSSDETESKEESNPVGYMLKNKGISIESVTDAIAEPTMDGIMPGQMMLLLAIDPDAKAIEDKKRIRHKNYPAGVAGWPVGLFDDTTMFHNASPQMMDTFLKSSTSDRDQFASKKDRKTGEVQTVTVVLGQTQNGSFAAEEYGNKLSEKVNKPDKNGVSKVTKTSTKLKGKKGDKVPVLDEKGKPVTGNTKEDVVNKLKQLGYTLSPGGFKSPYRQSVSGSTFNDLVQKAKAATIKIFAQPQLSPQQKLVEYLSTAFPGVVVEMDAASAAFNRAKFTGQKLFSKSNKANQPFGYVGADGVIHLDPTYLNNNTPIHEFGHIWNTFAKQYKPEIYKKGVELIEGSKYQQAILESPAYKKIIEDTFGKNSIIKDKATGKFVINDKSVNADAAREYIADEALATAIGDKGEMFVNQAQKMAFTKWLDVLFTAIRKLTGFEDYTNAQMKNMTLDQFVNAALKEVLGGKKVSDITSKDVSKIEGKNAIKGKESNRFSFYGAKGAKALDTAEGVETRISFLKNAKDLTDQGVSPRDVKLMTGWELGVDGKWKYEVVPGNIAVDVKDDVNIAEFYGRYFVDPDTGFVRESLSRDELLGNVKSEGVVTTKGSVTYPMQQFIGADSEYLKAYPALNAVKVVVGNFANMSEIPRRYRGTNSKGVFDPNTGKLYLNSKALTDQEKLRSTFLHELQHAIQTIERFARGSNPDEFDVDEEGAAQAELTLYELQNDYEKNNVVKAIIDSFPENGDYKDGTLNDYYEKVANELEVSPATVKYAAIELNKRLGEWPTKENYDAIVQEHLDYIKENDAFGKYKRTAGEVEARNVQIRMNMTAEERRASLASDTDGVDPKEQIVMFDTYDKSMKEAEGVAKGMQASREAKGKSDVTIENIDFEGFDEGIDPYEASETAEKIAKDNGVGILRGKELRSVAVNKKGDVVGGLWTEVSGTDFSFDIAIDKASQGKGIGEQLVNDAISQFDAEGGNDLDLNYKIEVTNPIMENLLKKYGFEVSQRVPGFAIMTHPTNNPKLAPQPKVTKASKGKRDVNNLNIEQFENSLKQKYPQLKTIFLSESKGVIDVDMVEVDKLSRNKGVGTSVMNDIISYANANNKEISLVPAMKDERSGTTSRGRLVDFYKKLGFVENTGRNKDFTKKIGSMVKKPDTSADTKSTFAKATDLFYEIKDTEGAAKKKRLADERKALMDANPSMKYIDDNIKNILDELEKNNKATRKGNCP